MGTVISVSPFKCRMWSMHDRHEITITEDSCRSEIGSFAKHGQLIPVLGRRLHHDTKHEFELIYGARRLFVARYLNKPLLMEVRDMSDREAIIAMDIENRQRTDISPYERGLSYAHWLRGGQFRSQEDLARALRVSPAKVSRLLQVAKLPSVIVGAFQNSAEICEGWGVHLAEALEDPARRQLLLQAARATGNMSPRSPARDVYRRLVAATARGRKAKMRAHDEVVADRNGQPLFRIRHHMTSIALVLPLGRTPAAVLDHIRDVLVRVYDREAAADAILVLPKALASNKSPQVSGELHVHA